MGLLENTSQKMFTFGHCPNSNVKKHVMTIMFKNYVNLVESPFGCKTYPFLLMMRQVVGKIMSLILNFPI